MSLSNGIMITSFGKYTNRKEFYDSSSDITDKSKNTFIANLMRLSLFVNVFITNRNTQIRPPFGLEKKLKMKEFW